MSELRKQSRERLQRELEELRTELRQLKTKVESGGAVEKPARIRNIKRRIARILTILNEQEEAS